MIVEVAYVMLACTRIGAIHSVVFGGFSPESLKDRITKRGNINEQYLTLEYLEKLNDAYSRFFLDYNDAPLLIINAADINLESNEADYESLITTIMSNPKGKNFINPQPSII